MHVELQLTQRHDLGRELQRRLDHTNIRSFFGCDLTVLYIGVMTATREWRGVFVAGSWNITLKHQAERRLSYSHAKQLPHSLSSQTSA